MVTMLTTHKKHPNTWYPTGYLENVVHKNDTLPMFAARMLPSSVFSAVLRWRKPATRPPTIPAGSGGPAPPASGNGLSLGQKRRRS